MIAITNIELIKIFRKWRTYIGFGAILGLTLIVQLAIYLQGETYIDITTRNLQKNFIFTGNLLNGYLVGNFILQALYIHIPFLVVLIGGDILASEATAGTYRMLLTRPVSRFRILTSKFFAGLIYTKLLLVWLAILSIGLSLVIFGSGELFVLSDKMYIFAKDDILWRFLFAYIYAILSMSVVYGLSFVFSSLVENAIGPIVASMAIIIVFAIISALNVEFLEPLKPYLFTNHLAKWKLFFNDPVNYSEVIQSAVVLFFHLVGFYLISLAIFIKKDVLS